MRRLTCLVVVVVILVVVVVAAVVVLKLDGVVQLEGAVRAQLGLVGGFSAL